MEPANPAKRTLRRQTAVAGLLVLAACANGGEDISNRPLGASGTVDRGSGGGPAEGSGGKGSGGRSEMGGAGGSGALGSGGSTANGGSSAGGGQSGGNSTGGASASGGASGSTGSGGSAGSSGGGGISTGSGGAGTGTVMPKIPLPYSETFEDGTADGWAGGFDQNQMPLGMWAVTTDGTTKVYEEQQATSSTTWVVGGDAHWTDQHFEAKVKYVSGSSSGLATLVIRFVNFKTYCFLEVHSNQLKIRVKNDGSSTDVATYKFPTPLVDGTWYSVGVSASGTTFGAYFNGAQVATGMNASIAAGGIALTATNAVVEFDDLSVTAP
jgi:hypothetical protein